MSELPLRYKRAAGNYEVIETDGLRLYPVRVKEYDEWCIARTALDVMQQAFPARLAGIPLLSALYRIDLEAMVNAERPSGLFTRALLAIALALRLGEGKAPEERVRMIRAVTDKQDPMTLKSLRLTLNGEEIINITPVQFQRFRPIIAAQNGLVLESELANPELVEAEREMAELNAPKLEADIDRLIASVAAFSRSDEREIQNWPILKLMRRAESYKMALDYLACAIGETQGTKWKGGNPAPHPFFPKAKEGFSAVTPVSEFGGSVLAQKH